MQESQITEKRFPISCVNGPVLSSLLRKKGVPKSHKSE